MNRIQTDARPIVCRHLARVADLYPPFFYDSAQVESLREIFEKAAWALTHKYNSIWRVLHIDGLEGYPAAQPLPCATGRNISFFSSRIEMPVPLTPEQIMASDGVLG